MAHFVLILQILAGNIKRLQFLPFEGTVVTKQTTCQILNTFEVTSPMTSLTEGRFMHDALSHSTFRENFDFTMRRKRFLQVSHSNCLCHWVVRAICLPFLREAFLPFVRLGWVGHWKMISAVGWIGPYCFTTIQCRF